MDKSYYRSKVPPYWKGMISTVYHRHETDENLDSIMESLVQDIQKQIRNELINGRIPESEMSGIKAQILERY